MAAGDEILVDPNSPDQILVLVRIQRAERGILPTAGITKDGEVLLTNAGLTVISYGGYLNGESFQEDGIVSYNGYQCAAFWNTCRHVVMARRALPGGAWSTFEFTDYTRRVPVGIRQRHRRVDVARHVRLRHRGQHQRLPAWAFLHPGRYPPAHVLLLAENLQRLHEPRPVLHLQ